MLQAIEKRIKALEQLHVGSESYAWVRLPDGSEAETPVREWYKHRYEWEWLRMGRGYDPAFGDLKLVLDCFSEDIRWIN